MAGVAGGMEGAGAEAKIGAEGKAEMKGDSTAAANYTK